MAYAVSRWSRRRCVGVGAGACLGVGGAGRDLADELRGQSEARSRARRRGTAVRDEEYERLAEICAQRLLAGEDRRPEVIAGGIDWVHDVQPRAARLAAADGSAEWTRVPAWARAEMATERARMCARWASEGLRADSTLDEGLGAAFDVALGEPMVVRWRQLGIAQAALGLAAGADGWAEALPVRYAVGPDRTTLGTGVASIAAKAVDLRDRAGLARLAAWALDGGEGYYANDARAWRAMMVVQTSIAAQLMQGGEWGRRDAPAALAPYRDEAAAAGEFRRAAGVLWLRGT